MKKLPQLLATSLLCIGAWQSYAQVYPPAKELFVPTNPGPNNPQSKPGWNLTYNDEFTSSPVNANWNKSALPFCYGNTDVPESDCIYTHNSNSNYLFWSNTDGGVANLVITKNNPDAKPANCGSPYCMYPKEYTGGILASVDCADNNNNNTTDAYENEVSGRSWLYGYFEVRCKIPKMQFGWAGAVLYGNNGNGVTEIDLTELFGNSKYAVFTNHYAPAPGQPDGVEAKWVYSMPGQSFSDDYVTYAIRWDPKRIVHYVNNIPVKVYKGNRVPQKPMSFFIGPKVGKSHLNSNVAAAFPCTTLVDYVRIYQRPDDPNGAFIDFTVNGKKGSTATSQLSIPFATGKPLILNGLESYDPNENWAISIRECSPTTGLGFGYEHLVNLSATEKANIDKVDLVAFASGYITFTPGHSYYVKLISTGPTWKDKGEWINLSTCSSSVAFSINGKANTAVPTPVTVGFDTYIPDFILNASATNACTNQYWLSIQPCDQNGNYNGSPEYGGWLSASQVAKLQAFDLYNYYSNSYSNANKFEYGNYYRIKLAVPNDVVGQNWIEKVQILKVDDCDNTIRYKINGTQQQSTQIAIPAGSPIIMDASATKLCSANSFSVSIVACDASGNNFTGTPVSESGDDRYIANFDIRDFCGRNNFTLSCGNYYLITVSAGVATPVSQKIYINSCVSNKTYQINGSALATVVIDNSVWQASGVLLHSTPSTISCNNMYFVAVQQLDNTTNALTGPEISKWLSQDEVDRFKHQGYSLSDLWNTANLGPMIPASGTCKKYRVKLVAGYLSCGNSSWEEELKVLKFTNAGATCPSSFRMAEPEAGEQATEEFIAVYPNPNNGHFFLKYDGTEACSIEIYNALGQLVKSQQNIMPGKDQPIEATELGEGVFLIKILLDKQVSKVQKILIQKDN